jgi:hypothetical protein
MTDWLDEGTAGKAVDVAAVMDSAAAELAWRVVQAGALLSFGRTSDGGALGVTVTIDGRWRREYFRDAEDLTEWLTGAADYAEGEAARQDASPSRRKRSRAARDR